MPSGWEAHRTVSSQFAFKENDMLIPDIKKRLQPNAVVISVAKDGEGNVEVRIASDLPITPFIIEWGPKEPTSSDETHHCYVETVHYGEAGITNPIPDKLDQMNEADTQAISGWHLSEEEFTQYFPAG
jgi:hypothetical protein